MITLQKKLEIAESQVLNTFEESKEKNAKVSERMNFLEESVKRSDKEHFAIERKLLVANKKAKNKENENTSLNQKIKVFEDSNSKLLENIKMLKTEIEAS